ncbi:diguanylate cyclase (GGDEF) domain-containing protein [Atopomonas hussainii]|uniref:diguanylate cyclase n=1 Tax=Atopomonas hussainii TaxID=1429083 RepID=A0A1H7I0A2_9GAMM|nr:diguanylate cyclase [Atopomonas hussainii]SEK55297.1 diguanylate cyclase (GGDEF) domain-containing protein [Atopomonas hussainii]
MKRTYHYLISLCWLLGFCLQVSAATAIDLSQPSYNYLGKDLYYLLETRPQPLTLAQAMQAQRQGQFMQHPSSVLHLGINPPAHWVYLPLENQQDRPVLRYLEVGPVWVDRFDAYLVENQHVLFASSAGDELPQHAQPVPVQGYVMPLQIPPGRSALFLRFETIDTQPLMLRLLTSEQQQRLILWNSYSHGGLYGFLLALIAFNLMLFGGLRDRNSLNYSVFLATFIALNLTYTGHLNAWGWPETASITHYGIVVLMVAMAWTGLHFARHFLQLAQFYPRLNGLIKHYSNACLLLVVAFASFDMALPAQYLTFAALVAFPFIMMALGALCWRKGLLAARYFLAATTFGMLGTAISNLTVMGVLPFTLLGYRAVEVGLLIEATLLALALAYRMRQHQAARLRAEELARTDPLTQLLNRRAFFELSDRLWSTSIRNQRPLAVILIDIDHFKRINDEHGHATGDLVLVAVSTLLQQLARHGDLTVRWGGEEFLLLLPETNAEQACLLAERLCVRIAQLKPSGIAVSASLGVAQLGGESNLDELINTADEQLYRAKHAGRNQVVCAHAAGE